MAFPAAKYAVVSTLPASARPTRVTAREDRSKELRLKAAIDRANAVLDRLEERQSELAAAIKELQRAKALYAARCERITDRILTEMEDAGLNYAAGVHTSFTKRPAPESAEIVDEKAIPAQYLREKIVTSPDKMAIKAAINRGESVPGVRLTQKLTLLRSK